MTDDDDLAVLRRALDQLADLLTGIGPEASGDPTPCTDWTVQDLVDHVVAAPARFTHGLRGESIDWSAPTPPAGDDPARAFRSHADGLLAAWGEHDGPAREAGLDWQLAELAVHTWDLATAVHLPTSGLDPQVPERGMVFMEAALTPENRAPAFGPPQPALPGADGYARIAAFAGRPVP